MDDSEADCWRLPDVLGGSLMMRADVRRMHFPKHFHDDYTFGLITRGANRFSYRGQRVLAPAGAICLADPGEVHTGEADEEGWSYWTIHVAPEAVARLRGELDGTAGRPPDFRAGVIEDERAVRRLAGFFRRARTADGLERESRAVMALSELIRRHTTAPTPALPESVDAAVAARVRDCLGDRLAEPVTLADLETATGVGRFRLLRAFRRRYGLPPHAWRTQKRLAAAQGLIAAGRPIAEAAAETGFADQAHLTRTFRRFLGYTPGRLARAAAA